MLAYPLRPLRWLVVLGVLAGSLGLPLGGTGRAQAADKQSELKKIDKELDHLVSTLKKKKKHKKKHHKKKSSQTAAKKKHKKKHHHKKKAMARQLEQKLDNVLNKDLGKKS